MRSAVAIGLLVLALTGTASAQPGVTAPNPPQQAVPRSPGVQPPPSAEPEGWELSESTALWLSLGGTAASWGLIVAATQLTDSGTGVATLAALGTVGAPSLGHLYADSFGTRGLGVRLAGAGVAFLGAILRVLETADGGRASGSGELLTGGLLYGGAALFVAGTIDDIVTAPAAVRRYNRRLHGVTIAPMIGPDRGGVAGAAPV